MSLTSKIFLNSRYQKKDGSQAIIIRITLDRESMEFSTGYSIDPKYWNDRKSEIKPSCPDIKNVGRLNKMIREQRISLEDRIMQFQSNGEIKTMSKQELKKRLLNKNAHDTTLQFIDKLIAELQTSGRVGNARVYRTLYNGINSFLDKKDIPLKRINYKWLKSYESWYLGKGNKINGLSVHMRTLRAVLNRAISEGLLSKEEYAFENYTIRTEKNQKRAITESDVDLLKAYTPVTKQQVRAKDYFFLSFYLMGCSFIDLAFLKLENINDGRIEYRRRKTGQLHSIKITTDLQSILDKYIQGKSSTDYILNVIKSEDTAKQYIEARDELKRYNKRIKKIGQECGIKQPITSYVARHTFASIAKFKNVPIPVIGQALGHHDTKVTEVYLDQFGNDMLDKYNELILGNNEESTK